MHAKPIGTANSFLEGLGVKDIDLGSHGRKSEIQMT